MKPKDLESLLNTLPLSTRKRILAELQGNGEVARPPLWSQVMTLRDLHSRYSVTNIFQDGQFVRLKDGLGLVKNKSRQTMAIMFWRYLVPEDYQDREIVTKFLGHLEGSDGQFDCLIAYTSDEGETTVFLPENSSNLELWHPEKEE